MSLRDVENARFARYWARKQGLDGREEPRCKKTPQTPSWAEREHRSTSGPSRSGFPAVGKRRRATSGEGPSLTQGHARQEVRRNIRRMRDDSDEFRHERGRKAWPGTAGGRSATSASGARNTDPESSHRAVQTCAGLGYDEHARLRIFHANRGEESGLSHFGGQSSWATETRGEGGAGCPPQRVQRVVHWPDFDPPPDASRRSTPTGICAGVVTVGDLVDSFAITAAGRPGRVGDTQTYSHGDNHG